MDLVSGEFFYAGLRFSSRCCVVPVIADSHLNQVSFSFYTFPSAFTWHAVHVVSVYLHGLASCGDCDSNAGRRTTLNYF